MSGFLLTYSLKILSNIDFSINSEAQKYKQRTRLSTGATLACRNWTGTRDKNYGLNFMDPSWIFTRGVLFSSSVPECNTYLLINVSIRYLERIRYSVTLLEMVRLLKTAIVKFIRNILRFDMTTSVCSVNSYLETQKCSKPKQCNKPLYELAILSNLKNTKCTHT